MFLESPTSETNKSRFLVTWKEWMEKTCKGESINPSLCIVKKPQASLVIFLVVLVPKSHLTLLWPPWTVDRQAPLSLGFPRQEYQSGFPFPSPGDLPDPRIEPVSPALASTWFLYHWTTGKALGNFFSPQLTSGEHRMWWGFCWSSKSFSCFLPGS